MNLEKLVVILKKNQKLYGKYDNDFVTYRDLIDSISELQYIENKQYEKELENLAVCFKTAKAEK